MEHEQTPFYRAVDTPSLGRAITDARKEAGLTQQDLAERLKVTRGTIIRLERGEAVSVVVAMRAIRVLGRDVAPSATVLKASGPSVSVRDGRPRHANGTHVEQKLSVRPARSASRNACPPQAANAPARTRAAPQISRRLIGAGPGRFTGFSARPGHP